MEWNLAEDLPAWAGEEAGARLARYRSYRSNMKGGKQVSKRRLSDGVEPSPEDVYSRFCDQLKNIADVYLFRCYVRYPSILALTVLVIIIHATVVCRLLQSFFLLVTQLLVSRRREAFRGFLQCFCKSVERYYKLTSSN